MAKLERMSPSSHVLTLKDGTRVLFSYDTPVAAEVPAGWLPDHRGGFTVKLGGYLKSAAFHSRTTSGHVARFLAGQSARAVDQAVLNSLVEGV